jgi:hypothetical protein
MVGAGIEDLDVKTSKQEDFIDIKLYNCRLLSDWIINLFKKRKQI